MQINNLYSPLNMGTSTNNNTVKSSVNNKTTELVDGLYSIAYPNGIRLSFTLKNGIREGEACETKKNGNIKFTYEKGIRQGKATMYDAGFGTTQFNYEKGIKQGAAKICMLNGIEIKFNFKNNLPEGIGIASYNKNSLECPIINGQIKCSKDDLNKLMGGNAEFVAQEVQVSQNQVSQENDVMTIDAIDELTMPELISDGSASAFWNCF